MIPTKQVGQKSKVAVFVRLRPANKEEQSEPTVLRIDRAQKAIFVRDVLPQAQPTASTAEGKGDGEHQQQQRPAVGEKEFHFSDVLPPDADQAEVYDVVARANVDAIFEGHFSTIMAYGQTGTGKTYTLASRTSATPAATASEAPTSTTTAAGKGKGSEGIITRALQHIFDRIGRDEGHEYTVSIEFIQIYKEVINDLLRMDNRDLQIREDQDRGVFLNGVTSTKVRTVEEALRVFDEGTRHRASALTSMNAESSRSHACFVLNVQRRKKLSSADVDGCGKGHTVARGRLTIVDLAGSERLKKTNAKGAQKQEAQAINLSLSCLGNVVHALTDPRAAHIPYRDSKLTRLLQESLGGCGKTSIIICVSPSATHVGETLSTLLFGQRAACVEQSEVSHMEMDWKALALQLQAQLEQAHLYIQYLKERMGADGPKRRHGFATPAKVKAPPPLPLIALPPEYAALTFAGMAPPAARESRLTKRAHRQPRQPLQEQEKNTGIPVDFLLQSPSLHPTAAISAAATGTLSGAAGNGAATRALRPWNSPAPHYGPQAGRSHSAHSQHGRSASKEELDRVEREAAQLLLMASPSLAAAAAHAQSHGGLCQVQAPRTPAPAGGQRSASASRLPLQQVVNSPPPPLLLPKGIGAGVLMPPAAAASLTALGAPKSLPRPRNPSAAMNKRASNTSVASSALGRAAAPLGSARDPLVRRSLFGNLAAIPLMPPAYVQQPAREPRKRLAEGARMPQSMAKRPRL